MPDTKPQGRWRGPLVVMVSVLLLSFLGLALLQGRQHQLLNATTRFQDDYLTWSLFQFETEHLKLSMALQDFLSPQPTVDAEELEKRYEIFISRLAIIEGEHAATLLRSKPEYLSVGERCRAFVKWADALPLDANWLRTHPEQVRSVLDRVVLLREPIHELSLMASHVVADQLTQRNELVRTHNRISIALSVVQGTLILLFAWVIVKQFKRLDRYGRSQQGLVGKLEQARHEAEAGSRAKSAFLANMSHELRTPMHGLLGMLELLRDSPLRSEQQRQLSTAHDSAKHLLAVLNDILDISKMEAGGLTLHPEPIRLRQVLLELDELCRPLAIAKGLSLDISIEDDVPEWVHADITRLRQILLNLLSNALKFSEQGQVRVRLSRQVDVLGCTLLRFEVSDQGIGMDSALLSQLFKRFTQGDNSRSRRFSGTGLGLEISRNLAHAMQGEIYVSSIPGKGSTFTLELPLGECAPPGRDDVAERRIGEPVAAGAPPGRSPPLQGLHILVSEDNPTNCIYLEAVLERLGHTAVFCENGHLAVDALAQSDFDLVLMDLHTPVMDGFEATRAIRALPEPKCSTTILALSADAFEETRLRCLESQMDGFLGKPVSAQALSAAIQSLAARPSPSGRRRQDLAPGAGQLAQHGAEPRSTEPALPV